MISSFDPHQISKSNQLLGVLIIVAVAMGYLLYQKISPKTNQSLPIAGEDKAAELTSDERAVLNYQGTTSGEEWNQFLALVNKLAVETNTITIGENCSITPVVMKISLASGKRVTVKNTDSAPHTLSSNNPPHTTIPAGGTAQMSVDFGSVLGIYGYGCDNSAGPVGLIQVLP